MLTRQPIVVAGVGTTAFSRAGRSVRDTAQEAVSAALCDAGVLPQQVRFVAFANAVGGLVTGQEMIRAQAALRHTGLLGATMVSVENACASGAAAIHLCAQAIWAGTADVAVAVGAERLTSPDRATTFNAIGSALDLEQHTAPLSGTGVMGTTGATETPRSAFVDVYSEMAVRYMQRTGATVDDLAGVVVKNRRHASGNPHAQLRRPVTVAEVLHARTVQTPLTAPMCSPIGDGAAALVLASQAAVRRLGLPRHATIRSTVVLSGRGDASGPTVVERAAARAFEEASVAPTDVNLAEVHDGAAPGELVGIEQLGLCEPGDAVQWLRDGVSTLGGRCPVNPSGGLLSRGHPIGATGVAQVAELAMQLSARAAGRQVADARVAVAENVGGWMGRDSAVGAVTILTR